MTHLELCLGESLHPRLERFVVLLLDLSQMGGVPGKHSACHELRRESAPKILPGLDGPVRQLVPPSTGFAREGGIKHPTPDGVGITVCSRPRIVKREVVDGVPRPVEQGNLGHPELWGIGLVQEVIRKGGAVPLQEFICPASTKEAAEALKLPSRLVQGGPRS